MFGRRRDCLCSGICPGTPPPWKQCKGEVGLARCSPEGGRLQLGSRLQMWNESCLHSSDHASAFLPDNPVLSSDDTSRQPRHSTSQPRNAQNPMQQQQHNPIKNVVMQICNGNVWPVIRLRLFYPTYVEGGECRAHRDSWTVVLLSNVLVAVAP